MPGAASIRVEARPANSRICGCGMAQWQVWPLIFEGDVTVVAGGGRYLILRNYPELVVAGGRWQVELLNFGGDINVVVAGGGC